MKHYLHIDGYWFRKQGIKQCSKTQKKKVRFAAYRFLPQSSMAQAVLWCYGFVDRTQHTVRGLGVGKAVMHLLVDLCMVHTDHIHLCMYFISILIVLFLLKYKVTVLNLLM